MSEKLTMTVDIRAQLNQFNAAMDNAKEVLNKTFSGKGIKTYTDELNKVGRIFDKITRTTAGPIDSKATFAQMQKEVMDANQRLETLRDTISNIRNLTLTQRLSFLPDNFQQNLEKATIAIEKYQKAISKIGSSKIESFSSEGIANGAKFSDIDKELKKVQEDLEQINKLEEKINSQTEVKRIAEEQLAREKELKTLIDQKQALEQKSEAQKEYNKLVEQLKGKGIAEAQVTQKANEKRSGISSAVANSMPQGLSIDELNRRIAEADRVNGRTDIDDPTLDENIRRHRKKIQEKQATAVTEETKKSKSSSSAKKTKENNADLEETISQAAAAYNKLNDAKAKTEQLNSKEIEQLEKFKITEEITEELKKLADAHNGNVDTLNKTSRAITQASNGLTALKDKEQTLKDREQELIEVQKQLQDSFDAKSTQEKEEALKPLVEIIQELGIDTATLGDLSGKSAKELKKLVTSLYDEQVVVPQLEKDLPELIHQIETLGDRSAEVSVEVDKSSEAFDKLSERSENIDRLTARVKQFTGFVGVINLARKAMRDALSTVQELDKAMTSMAVVTKSTVSDYWEQLPKYTERANKLGATIRDMYEADTLYYQQGLKTNQVMQVANETMKMARIAGLGAAEATDRMTNALRGFNMAINEESAQRINDVYSKLAAITASNVDEISTAMTKTASIAHSAGMEFETTAAFLSQIIETTRESAETAGTALKTVIARFQELKKAPSEIGEVDGEIVDANKIEGALRTVGVALRDSEGQFRKLDDVFMELAGKWGSMDKNTQRYIATIAAGSRQQSRFIALMQDYSHTVELVDAAYTSAGTSQQQYEKTLESMETILKRLQNSWNTFTMGLFNSNLLKGFMKGGTELLNLLNKILDALDFTNLGIGKIAITAVGINKLGIAFKIFTNQLKQDNGTIANSFGAIGKSIGDWWVNFGKIKDNSNVATKATRDYAEAVALSNIADRKAIETKKALEKETANLTRLNEQLKIQEANRNKAVSMTRGRLRASEGRVETLKDQDALAQIAKGNAGDVVAQTYEKASKALMNYGKSLNLSNKASERFSELILQSNTALEDTERVTLLTTIATDENTASELLNNKERLAAMTTEELQQVVEEKHLVLRELTNAQLKVYTILNSKLLKVLTLGFSAKMADIALDKAKASSAGAATAAVGAFTVASLASLAAIGLIAGAVIVLTNAIKALIAQKLENRIKRAREELDSLNESLGDCKDALKDLEEQQDKYNSLHEELHKNIQGTKEWKEKLVEVNEQVYDLLQKYPTLANYISRSAAGELSISLTGWDTIISQQQEKLKRTQIAQRTSQSKLNELNLQSELKNLYKQFVSPLNRIGISLEEFGRIVRNYNPEEAVEKLEIKTELTSEATSAFGKYKNSVEQNTKALDLMREAYIGTTGDNIKDKAGNILRSNLDSSLSFENNFLLTGFKKGKKEYQKMAEDIAGATSTKINIPGLPVPFTLNIGGDYRENKNFRKIFEDFGGKVKDLSGNDKTALAQWVLASRQQNYEDDALLKEVKKDIQNGKTNELIIEGINNWIEYTFEETIKEKIEQLNKEQQKALSQVGDIKDLTRDTAKVLSSIQDEEIQSALNAILENFNAISFSSLFEENFINLKNHFTPETQKQLEELTEYLNLSQLERLGYIIQSQASKGTPFNYSDILKKEGGGEMLESFMTFDLSSLEDLEKARKYLTEGWPYLTREINDMIDNIKNLGIAIHKVDLKAVIENVSKLIPLFDQLTEENHGTVFTEEEYKELFDQGVVEREQFIKNAEGQYILKTPLETLRKAVEENTKAILDETKEQIDSQYALANAYRNPQNPQHSSSFTAVDYALSTNPEAISSLGIEGITTYSDYLYAQENNPELAKKVNEKLKDLALNMTDAAYEEANKDLDDIRNDVQNRGNDVAGVFANDFNEFKNTGNFKAFDSSLLKMSSEEAQRYEQLLREIEDGSKEAEEEYTKFMEKLANKQAILTAEKNMKKYMGDIQSFVEEYKTLGDKTLKYNKTLEIANVFGIRDITEDNYEFYAELFNQFSQGNMEAYNILLGQILGAHGYALEDANQLFTEASNNWSEEAFRLKQILIDLGLAYAQVVDIGGGQKAEILKKYTGGIPGVPKSSGGGKEDKWEDPYNWLWNINKRINKEIFERERLERRYQKAVEDATKSEEELYEVSKKELENLERQAILERDKGQKAMQEAQMMMKQRPEFGNYVSWNAENGQIQVDYNKIDKENWGSARGEAFEAFVSRLEELNDEVQDSQTTLEEIEDLTEDIKNRGREQFIELQERIKNALVEINQRQIDTAQKINDSIKTAQDELLNKIQEEISETRQIRSNQEKEQELEDKRQRLSYLRRDTTGANAVQIRQLEEELRKGEQSYTDSLTDQTLQNIQKANQKAEEQRAEEIEIMNNQLTRWQETGAIWDTVNTSIQEGFNNPDSFLNSNVASLIASAENRRALSEIQQADWDKDLENQAKLAELFNNGQLYQQGEQTLESVRSCQNSLATTKSIVGVIGQVDHDLYDYLTNVYPKDYADKIDGVAGGVSTANVKLQQILEKLGLTNNSFSSIGNAVTQVFKEISNFFGKETPLPTRIKKLENALYGREQSEFTVNATGGLNTKTGFAWLDGTPTKPEYVLNADQTKAFFNLVNTLTSDSSKGGVSGDNYFDIDINVDELSNDYDVDQLAARIKEQIWEDSQYRNVNLVNLLR